MCRGPAVWAGGGLAWGRVAAGGAARCLSLRLSTSRFEETVEELTSTKTPNYVLLTPNQVQIVINGHKMDHRSQESDYDPTKDMPKLDLPVGANPLTLRLVNRYALIAVDVFSKYVWVRLLQTPIGAGVAAAWTGLKTNPAVIVTAKGLDSILAEIDADLRDEQPARQLKDLNLKLGSDNGSEFDSPDLERVVTAVQKRQRQ